MSELVKVVRDETDEQYHQSAAVSSSLLKTLWTRDAETAEYERVNPKTDTSTFAKGRAVHSLVLGAGADVELKLDGRTKAGKEQAERAKDGGIILLTAADMAAVEAMTESVLQNEFAAGLLEGTERETSIYWTDTGSGLDVRARLDAHDEYTIVDLKTTRDPAPHAFSRQAAQLGYLIQAGLYTIGWQHALAVEHLPSFYFLAVGVNPPYQVSAYRVTDEDLTLGMELARHLLARWQQHVKAGIFPGLPDQQTLIVPDWAINEMTGVLP